MKPATAVFALLTFSMSSSCSQSGSGSQDAATEQVFAACDPAQAANLEVLTKACLKAGDRDERACGEWAQKILRPLVLALQDDMREDRDQLCDELKCRQPAFPQDAACLATRTAECTEAMSMRAAECQRHDGGPPLVMEATSAYQDANAFGFRSDAEVAQPGAAERAADTSRSTVTRISAAHVFTLRAGLGAVAGAAGGGAGRW